MWCAGVVLRLSNRYFAVRPLLPSKPPLLICSRYPLPPPRHRAPSCVFLPSAYIRYLNTKHNTVLLRALPRAGSPLHVDAVGEGVLVLAHGGPVLLPERRGNLRYGVYRRPGTRVFWIRHLCNLTPCLLCCHTGMSCVLFSRAKDGPEKQKQLLYSQDLRPFPAGG